MIFISTNSPVLGLSIIITFMTKFIFFILNHQTDCQTRTLSVTRNTWVDFLLGNSVSTSIFVVSDAHRVRHAGELKGKEIKSHGLFKMDWITYQVDIYNVDQLFGAGPI